MSIYNIDTIRFENLPPIRHTLKSSTRSINSFFTDNILNKKKE